LSHRKCSLGEYIHIVTPRSKKRCVNGGWRHVVRRRRGPLGCRDGGSHGRRQVLPVGVHSVPTSTLQALKEECKDLGVWSQAGTPPLVAKAVIQL